tara:strand:+ start:63 stop:725 length:663 start_codon:yes stop_codon:yes gene_type:complete
MSTDNNPEGNPPEIKIEIDPTPAEDLPPPSTEASGDTLPDLDDLPPVSDDDLDDLPPVPEGELDDLPPVDTPIRIDTDTAEVSDLPPVDGPPDVELPPLDEPDGGDDLPAVPPDTPVGKLVLESVLNPGQNLSMGVNTKVGKRLCKSLGEDSKFLDNEQMELIKTDSGWQVSPNVSAANETLLNNKAITEPQDLNEGDILAVGREAKGVSKMEMRVSFSS